MSGSFKVRSPNPGPVLIQGGFAPAGTGAPTTVRGADFSISRVGVGQYRATFDKAYPALLNATASARVASESKFTVTCGDYSAANRTLDFFTHKQVPGWIPLDITALREIASNDIQNLAAHGGIMASDSTPSLARVNGATDKALRVIWASSNSNEAQFPPVMYPPDLDGSSNLTVELLARMAGATDTPTIDVQAFDGVGNAEMGGATGALSATLQKLQVTLALANISGYGTGFLNISLVPGAHTTDALWLYGAGIAYTRALLTDLAADADNRIEFSAMFQNSGLPTT